MSAQSSESKPIPRRTASPWLVALCWVALSTLATTTAGAQHHHRAGQSAAPAIGSPAVPFELKSLDGQSVGSANFHGKPLVVNFFASWCDPCREEMPLLNELATKGAKQGYSVLGIAVEDSRAAVTEFAKESKLVFPIALDLNSTVKRAYRIFGPPATFFIDGRGVIRDVVLGPIMPERARAAMKTIGVRQ